MKLNEIRDHYIRLLESGMFWEIYPDLTGKWENDGRTFIKSMNKKQKEMEESIKDSPLENTIDTMIDDIKEEVQENNETGKSQGFKTGVRNSDVINCNPSENLIDSHLSDDIDENPPENEKSEESAVEYIESNYPEMTEEFKRIQREQYETFCRKQRNYGPDNISVGTKLETDADIKVSLTGIWFRVNDKIQRLKQMVVLGQPDEVGESVQDSFDDLSIYGIIAQMVSNGKWAK